MSLQNLDTSPSPQTEWEDTNRTSNLWDYPLVLQLWWREILLIAFLSALAAGGATFLLNSMREDLYSASATVVVARSTSNVTLDERFETSTDDTAAFRNATIEAARRASLVGLVENSAIASTVIEELGSILTEEEKVPARLLEMVTAEAVPGPDNRTPSDLIRIAVTADSPQKAAAIANSWVDAYVSTINAIYGQVPDEVLSSLNEELSLARSQYEAAQANLEEYIATNQAAALTRQIQQYETLLTSLREAELEITAAVLERDRNLRVGLFNRLIDAQTNPALEALDAQTRQNVETIRYLYTARVAAEQYLAQAKTMKEQIEEGGDAAAASNALALQMLKTQIYAPTSPIFSELPIDSDSTEALQIVQLPSSMQWTVQNNETPTTATEQLRDVDALIGSLDGFLGRLDADIAEFSTSLDTGNQYRFLGNVDVSQFSVTELSTTADATEDDPLAAAIQASYLDLFEIDSQLAVPTRAEPANSGEGSSSAIIQIEQLIRQLAAQIEQFSARERELTRQRDLTWNVYDTLNFKIGELTLERTAANREVRIGSTAPTPIEPTPQPSPLSRAIIGGVLGLFVGIMSALILDFMGKRPFLAANGPTAT